MTHTSTRRRRYAGRQRDIKLRVESRAPAMDLKQLEHLPRTKGCLCPGCYFGTRNGSEMCDRCALEACTNEVNRHG